MFVYYMICWATTKSTISSKLPREPERNMQIVGGQDLLFTAFGPQGVV